MDSAKLLLRAMCDHHVQSGTPTVLNYLDRAIAAGNTWVSITVTEHSDIWVFSVKLSQVACPSGQSIWVNDITCDELITHRFKLVTLRKRLLDAATKAAIDELFK